MSSSEYFRTINGNCSDRILLEARHDPDEFRSRVRGWLVDTVPTNWRLEQASNSEALQIEFQRWWFGKLSSIGMINAHWPASWGGEDIDIAQQIIFYEELARAKAPNTASFIVSLNQVPATLFGAGTQAQKDRFIGGVLSGDIWCQGFSEPNAGSDLAAIRTKAFKKNETYIISGQKIWTSYAHFSKYCLLLARTDPDSNRHHGLSLFILDMSTPGITLRPILQANGQAEFNEMFLDNVEIPTENLIGQEGDGWRIAQSALSAERGLMIFELSERLRCFMRDLTVEARAGALWWRDDQYRREFVKAYMDMEALRLMIRAMLHQSSGQTEMSGLYAPIFVKLHYAQLLQRFGDLMVRVHGLQGQELRPDIATNGSPGGNWMFDYMTSWVWTISGGTNEIIRNIISERVLGLPR